MLYFKFFRKTQYFLKETIWRDTISISFSKQTMTILVLSFFVFAFNISKANAQLQEKALLTVGNESSVEIIKNITEYTPFLEENTDELIDFLNGEDSGLIEKPTIQETIQSPNSYTVQKGETLSQIAAKFNLHVATIIEASDLTISEISNLQPGTVLTIPPYDTSTSMAWLDEINRIKVEKEAKAKAEADKIAKQRAALATKTKKTGSSKLTSGATYSGAENSNFIVPISSKGITRGISRGHTGIDYRADTGTPVTAANNGTIIEITAGWSGGWGNSVVISHGNGITTRYAHLSRSSVSVGQLVGQGAIIGYSGSTGFSTGPHLHFEARRNGSVINPFSL